MRLGPVKPDPGLRRRSSSNWVEFEDTSALGRFHRMVEIDTIDDANEPDTERYASRVRTENGVVRGRPLFRPRMATSPFGPIGMPATRRNFRIGLKNLYGHHPCLSPERTILL
jgi:hypothetical protein